MHHYGPAEHCDPRALAISGDGVGSDADMHRGHDCATVSVDAIYRPGGSVGYPDRVADGRYAGRLPADPYGENPAPEPAGTVKTLPVPSVIQRPLSLAAM